MSAQNIPKDQQHGKTHSIPAAQTGDQECGLLSSLTTRLPNATTHLTSERPPTPACDLHGTTLMKHGEKTLMAPFLRRSPAGSTARLSATFCLLTSGAATVAPGISEQSFIYCSQNAPLAFFILVISRVHPNSFSASATRFRSRISSSTMSLGSTISCARFMALFASMLPSIAKRRRYVTKSETIRTNRKSRSSTRGSANSRGGSGYEYLHIFLHMALDYLREGEKRGGRYVELGQHE